MLPLYLVKCDYRSGRAGMMGELPRVLVRNWDERAVELMRGNRGMMQSRSSETRLNFEMGWHSGGASRADNTVSCPD